MGADFCWTSGADVVTIELIRAFRYRVLRGVEDGLVVVGPSDGVDALGVVRQQFARVQVFYGQRELAESGVIRCVR